MNKILIIFSILYLTLHGTAFSFESRSTSSQNWSDSAGFPTTYERLAKTTIAEIIEKKDSGFYGSWDQTNYFISNTAIGAQTVFSDSVLEGVQIHTANCGNTSSTTSLQSSGTTENHNTSAPCTIENSNAKTP